MNLFRRSLAEAVGTFALVFAGCGAIMVNAQTDALGHAGVAVTFGLVVMCMIFALGHISGAHFNPAVSLAFSLTRHLPVRDLAAYVVAQCLAAVVACGALRTILGDRGDIGATVPLGGSGQAFAMEMILTFFLMLVIMSVATDDRAVGANAAIAIGGTVGLDALFGGPITGASMNPARSLGPALISGTSEHLWLYIAAPVVGAVLGALTYQLIRGEKPQIASH